MITTPGTLHAWSTAASLDGRALKTLEDKICILADVAEALGYLHARGLIHRDIKPANILVSLSVPVRVRHVAWRGETCPGD
jgi:serine/threonine protein kinase